MSSRMQQLFTTLANIIIEYCDPLNVAVKIDFASQPSMKTTGAMEQSTALEQDEVVDSTSFDNILFSDLKERIDNTLSSQPNKINRASLMFYLLHCVDKLRPLMIEKTSYLDDKDCNELQDLMSKFVINMGLLLTKWKHEYIEIKYDDKNIVKIHGFKIGLFSTGICNSGKLIQKSLFPALKLQPNDCDSKIKDCIDAIFTEHQNAQILVLFKQDALVLPKIGFFTPCGSSWINKQIFNLNPNYGAYRIKQDSKNNSSCSNESNSADLAPTTLIALD